MIVSALVTIGGLRQAKGTFSAFVQGQMRGVSTTPSQPPFGPYSSAHVFQMIVYAVMTARRSTANSTAPLFLPIHPSATMAPPTYEEYYLLSAVNQHRQHTVSSSWIPECQHRQQCHPQCPSDKRGLRRHDHQTIPRKQGAVSIHRCSSICKELR